MTWRKRCAPLIRQVIKDNEGKTPKEIRAALRDAYPWRERAMHPYKIWCDEVRTQLGLKRKKHRGQIDDVNQQKLF